MSSLWQRCVQAAQVRRSSAPLCCFRVCFGLLLLWDAQRMWWEQELVQLFPLDHPDINFYYDVFPARHVRPYFHPLMYALPLVLALLASCLAAAVFPRLSAALLGLCSSYLFLCERGRYVNHHYLYILICGLLSTCDGLEDHLSLPFLFRKKKDGVAHYTGTRSWQLWALRAQFSIMYWYAGVAKLQGDFLKGVQVRYYLSLFCGADHAGICGVIQQEVVVRFLSYAAMIFDLLIGWALWAPTPVRTVAMAASAAFHLTNSSVFSTIYSFPFVCLSANALFTSPATVEPVKQAIKSRRSMISLRCLVVWIFFAFQIILPLRHLAITDDVQWTQQGELFSWRMMADLQDGFVMAIIPTPAGLEMVTPYDLHIHHRITSSLVISPSMLKQFASKASAHVQYKYALEALPPAYLEAWRTLNGRPMQRWIDPRVDLSQPQQLPLASTPPWVLPRMTDFDDQDERIYLSSVMDYYSANGYRVEAFMSSAHAATVMDRIYSKMRQDAWLVVVRGAVVVGKRDREGKRDYLVEQGKKTTLPFNEIFDVTVYGAAAACWLIIS